MHGIKIMITVHVRLHAVTNTSEDREDEFMTIMPQTGLLTIEI